MKRILSFLLAVTLVLSLCGCSMIEDILGDAEIPDIIGDLELPDMGDLELPDIMGDLENPFVSDEDSGAQQVTPTQMPADIERPTESAGVATEMITMPACEGQPLSSVGPMLQSLSFQVHIEYVSSSSYASGYVVTQSIPQGTKLAPGQLVTLVVSTGSQECPYEYTQKLTVTAPRGSSYATATLYEWEDGDWRAVASYSATVGKKGIGTAKEGSQTTPQGIFDLGVVLCSGNLNISLNVYRVSSSTGVVNDVDSPYYNRIMEKANVPSGTSFDMIGKGLCNGTTFATIYIEHNGSGLSSENVIPGNGSAIGIRGQYGTLSPTYGDVDIRYYDMIDLLSRLDKACNPVIEIKVA